MLRRLSRPVVDSSGAGLEAAIEAGASLIKPNEHELEGLTGSGSLESARELHRRSGVQVLLTRGERGAALIGEEVWEVEAPQIEVRNPVGSGDTLLGPFCGRVRAASRFPTPCGWRWLRAVPTRCWAGL